MDIKVVTAKEALGDYKYAVMSAANKTYGLYPDVDTAKRIADDLCRRYGEGTYSPAVIA